VSLVSVVHVATVLALTIAGTACGQAPPAPTKPLVVASFYPLYEFARQVAGDRAEAISLVPVGVEPHDWEPAPQDVARIERAKVFVYNGAGFDPWAGRLRQNLGASGPLVIEATAGLPLLTTDVPGRTGHDPHAWLDPMLAQAQVEAIRAGLARVDPAGATAYAANARAYTERLATLHAAFERGLSRCARRDFVVSHTAFAYLAHRYRLTQMAVMGLAPESEPSPAELAQTVRLLRRLRPKYVFFETLVSSRLADTLAAEVGAQTLLLDPVEGLTAEAMKAGANYLTVMDGNLQNLRRALECS
jgi:zinc transport system substrate-binding protein